MHQYPRALRIAGGAGEANKGCQHQYVNHSFRTSCGGLFPYFHHIQLHIQGAPWAQLAVVDFPRATAQIAYLLQDHSGAPWAQLAVVDFLRATALVA